MTECQDGRLNAQTGTVELVVIDSRDRPKAKVTWPGLGPVDWLVRNTLGRVPGGPTFEEGAVIFVMAFVEGD